MLDTLKGWLDADRERNDDRGWTYNLALFRIVFLGVTVLPFAWHIFRWTEHAMPALPKEVWVPISFFQYLPLDILRDPAIAYRLALLNVILIGLALLGVLTRWTLGLATVLSLYVFGLVQNQGKVDHFHHLVWFMALLALGPSGHFLSFDSIRRALRSAGQRAVEGDIPPSTALWTLRYVWILLGLLYLIPGIAKLEKAINGGWGNADNLRHILWERWFELYLYRPDFQLPWRIDLLPWPMLELAGVGIILFEILFIFLVLLRPVRPFLALGALAFHLGNGLFLDIWFKFLWSAYVCMFDWTAMIRRARQADCSLPGAARGREAVAIAWAGGFLVFLQAGASGLLFAHDLSKDRLPENHAARSVLSAFYRSKPVWPFDQYPSFAWTAAEEAEIWEARAVLSNGQEVRIGARAYAAALGSPSRCWSAAQGIRRERNPERHRARSLDLVRLLWRHEAPAVRDMGISLNVYHTRYSVNPSNRYPIGQRQIHSFPVELLSAADGKFADRRSNQL